MSRYESWGSGECCTLRPLLSWNMFLEPPGCGCVEWGWIDLDLLWKPLNFKDSFNGGIALTHRIMPLLSLSPYVAKCLMWSSPCRYFLSIFCLTDSSLVSSRCYSRYTRSCSLAFITLKGFSAVSRSSRFLGAIYGSNNCLKEELSFFETWLTWAYRSGWWVAKLLREVPILCMPLMAPLSYRLPNSEGLFKPNLRFICFAGT